MEQRSSTGERVREAISRVHPAGARTHGSIASDIGMTPDAFSRALSGGRAFSSLEIARLAGLLREDVHWLITGEPDPLRVRIAARHFWDGEAGAHHLPSGSDDNEVLDGIALAYRQAHPWRRDALVPLPNHATAVRAALGPDFVFTFADRVEQAFGVDVIRIQGLSTDYSITISDRRAILLRAEPQWYRSNWSLAHELGHLVFGHHAMSEDAATVHEAPANRFASEILLPEEMIRAIDWASCDEDALARQLWSFGVSTEALANRLRGLRLPVPQILDARPEGSTMRLLRRQRATLPRVNHAGSHFAIVDPITHRFDSAAKRRIPEALIAAHLDGIAEGRINKETLAWLLESAPDEVDLDEPPTPATGAMTTDELMSVLGI